MLYDFFKRILDILLSLLGLIILSPILIFLIILLKFSGEGEVFYFQERIGYKNKKFKIWKFATMIKNSPNIGSKDITLRDDPRVTKVGKFLRKTKLNELPQLFNILKGDLSIVGPRPFMETSFKKYSEEIQNKIYDVKPGLTGIGSIIFRDEEAILSSIIDKDPHEYYKEVIAPYKGALEIWYQEKKSLVIDVQLIFLTACAVIFPNLDLTNRIFKDLPKRIF